MEKIIIQKNDTAQEAIDKILGSESVHVVLVIPRNSGLKDSISNFHLLKRESHDAEKQLAVESVDEEVLALAKAAKIEAIHPLFEGETRGRSFSDIVPFARAAKEMLTKRSRKHGVTLAVAEGEDDSDEGAVMSRGKRKSLWVLSLRAFGIALSVLIVAVLSINIFFTHATILLRFQKIPLSYHGPMTVDATISAIDEKGSKIPGQLFTQAKTITQLFPASGHSKLSAKAEGVLTVYNAYSSAPQSLVATTRFVTSNGKIFRLRSGVVVPGARIENGKIISSSVDVSVVADVAGPDYNIGPTAKLSVPGFKGTPKYDGFYGDLSAGTNGGFSGDHAVPTDQDIALAKTKTNQILVAAFRETFLKNIPKDFVVPDGASMSQVMKISVNTATDQQGNFSVFGEAQFKAIGFRDQDMRAFLMGKAVADFDGKAFRTLRMVFSSPIFAFDKKNMRLFVDAEGDIASVFDPTVFGSRLSGLSEEKAHEAIAGLNGLSDATISFWPFWVRSVPHDTARLKLVVE